MSAESGIRTFREGGGLWEEHRIEDVATPEAWARNPQLVWQFYKQRWRDARKARPNPAHYALVELEQHLGQNFALITQNVDGLHSLAGNANPIEMHGSLDSCFCTRCSTHYKLSGINLTQDIPPCPKCSAALRPDIVWFGEIPYCLEEIEGLLKNCDVFLVVGSSGVVYPAAGFVMTAKYFGAATVAVNLDSSGNSAYIDEFHFGKAGELLPRLVEEWISG